MADAHFKRFFDLGSHGDRPGGFVVQVQRECTKTDRIQALLDDIEGSSLLGDEQHPPPRGHRMGKQVCDGLRLTGSRRAL